MFTIAENVLPLFTLQLFEEAPDCYKERVQSADLVQEKARSVVHWRKSEVENENVLELLRERKLQNAK